MRVPPGDSVRCLDCEAAPGRICAVHARTDNLSDEVDAMLDERDERIRVLTATAEDYDARLRRINEALRMAGVVAVEGGGVVPAEERIRRLAAESADLRARLERAEAGEMEGSISALLRAEVRRAVEQEREACAMLADETPWHEAPWVVAAAIRARGAR